MKPFLPLFVLSLLTAGNVYAEAGPEADDPSVLLEMTLAPTPTPVPAPVPSPTPIPAPEKAAAPPALLPPMPGAAEAAAPTPLEPAPPAVVAAPPAPTPAPKLPPLLPPKFTEFNSGGVPPRLASPLALPVNEGPEVAIILADGKFRPARVRLRSGNATRLLFTTVNRKPAALIIEKLKVQTWLVRPPSESHKGPGAEKWEVNREIASSRITDIRLDPLPGTYNFHDAISGASGEIIVE